MVRAWTYSPLEWISSDPRIIKQGQITRFLRNRTMEPVKVRDFSGARQRPSSSVYLFIPFSTLAPEWAYTNSHAIIIATPHVAGIAAYLMAKEGLRTPAAVRARLIQLASSTGALVSSFPLKYMDLPIL